jgi:ATP-dependent 26S proteasome regulatory subunit
VFIRKIKTFGKIDVDLLVESTEGFSGADIRSLFNKAGMIAFQRGVETCEVR